jgi:large subunit ribosomal protein L18
MSVKNDKRIRRHKKIRMNMHGTKDMPRLFVFRSNQHIYAQLINDDLAKKVYEKSSNKELLDLNKDLLEESGHLLSEGNDRHMARNANTEKVNAIRDSLEAKAGLARGAVPPAGGVVDIARRGGKKGDARTKIAYQALLPDDKALCDKLAAVYNPA